MYGGYQGAYGAYGNSTGQGYQQAQQQAQQPAQQYYTGVKPYANYGYGTLASAPPPPPPIPPVTTYTANAYSTFPSSTTTGVAATSQATYNGYDAAIYNYAQQTSPAAVQQQTQRSSNPYYSHQQNSTQSYQQRPMNWKAGGGGRQGRVQAPSDNKQYYCEACKISCAGGATYKEHINGQRHKKKEQQLKAGVPLVSLPKNKLSYRCELCDITCTGQDTYTAHIRGQKHVKTQQLHRKLGKPVPEDVPTIIAPSEDGTIVETRAIPKWHQQTVPGTKKVIGINTVNFVGGHKLNSTGQLEEKKKEVAKAVGSCGLKPSQIHSQQPQIEVEDEHIKAMMAAEEVLPIGEEYVEDERDATGKLVQYHCKICDCKFSDPNAKEVHVKGRRHRMSYKQKVDSSFVVDGSSRKRSDKKKGLGPGPAASGPSGPPSEQSPPVHFMKGPFFSTSDCNSKLEILDQITVDRKYESLNPGSEFPTNVDQFTNDIIESLKQVSVIIESEKTKDAENEKQTITGCMRVGVFAKNTYIKGEPYVEMVVQCNPIPTKELIERILKEFPNTSSQNHTQMTIEMDPSSPAVFIVSTTLFTNLKCRLYITSQIIRNDNEVENSECPDVHTCVNALALMRNAKWYESNYFNLCGLQPTIRLFRELRSRFPVWEMLDDRKLEMVIISIIDSDSYPDGLKVTAAFKRVLEAISSGFLFSAILVDPCEKGDANMLDLLPVEQKHALTESAQHFLRLIAFNQIHEILGVERHVDIVPDDTVVTATHKRALELLSGFNGDKLPENDESHVAQQEHVEIEDEPLLKKTKIEEKNGAELEQKEAEPMEETKPEVVEKDA